MEFKEIDMRSLNLSRARSLNHAIFFVTKSSLYGRYIYGKKNLVKASRQYNIWHLKLKFSSISVILPIISIDEVYLWRHILTIWRHAWSMLRTLFQVYIYK